MDKRYQVFISSTYEDLKAERDAVIKAVLEMGHFPVGMEMFNAADEEQWVTIQREIDRSDYYLLIVAHRYGSTIAAEGGISYTEKEFNYAVQTGVPRIGFEIARGATWNPDFVDDNKKKKRLDAFKAKVRTRPVDFWSSKEDLATKVVLSLGKLIANTKRPGWQRSNASTEELGSALAEMSKENIRLSRENTELKLAAQAIPKLQFYFSDEYGNSLGDVLKVNIADLNIYNNKIRESHLTIEKLLSQYDPTIHVNLTNDTVGEGKIIAKIPREKTQTIYNSLIALGFENPPKFEFTNLYTKLGTRTYNPETGNIDGGLDYQNYRIYKKIETEILNMEHNAREQAREANSFTYGIDCQNIGRVAAELVQVKIRAGLQTMARTTGSSYDDFNSAELYFDTGIDLLIPHEQLHVRGGRLNKSIAPGESIISIRALAKNLPESEEHQLKIVFYESDSSSSEG